MTRCWCVLQVQPGISGLSAVLLQPAGTAAGAQYQLHHQRPGHKARQGPLRSGGYSVTVWWKFLHSERSLLFNLMIQIISFQIPTSTLLKKVFCYFNDTNLNFGSLDSLIELSTWIFILFSDEEWLCLYGPCLWGWIPAVL